MQTKQTILFYSPDSTLYQLVSCFLNLQGFQVVASMKRVDIMHKIERQGFSVFLIGTESEVFLDELMSAISQKGNLNRATPVVLLNDKSHKIQIEEGFSPTIKGIVGIPFTLGDIHRALITAMSVAK
jgi:hypothetical protein